MEEVVVERKCESCGDTADVETGFIFKDEFGNPLEDMSPYISDEQIKENMIVDMIPRRDNSQGWVTLEK